MIKYSVYLNGKAVTPDEVRERLDANEGKCQFMLLPSGELRLRVYNDDHYSFFPLPSVYEVRLYAVEDPLTTDLRQNIKDLRQEMLAMREDHRQRVEKLASVLKEAKKFIGGLPVSYETIIRSVLLVLEAIDHALKIGDVEKSSLKETSINCACPACDHEFFNSELSALRAQVEEKNKALAKAEQWFTEYAERHNIKGDRDKAIRNMDRAIVMRVALAATGKPNQNEYVCFADPNVTM